MAQTPQTAKTWSVLDSGTHKPTGDKVTISGLDVFNQAYPTSRCLGGTGDFWAAAEYIERMVDKSTGKQYDVVYLFDDDDITGVEEEDYPFDEDHIARIFSVYN